MIDKHRLQLAGHRQVEAAQPVEMDAQTPHRCPEAQNAAALKEHAMEIPVE
jgi:hypothetical protein